MTVIKLKGDFGKIARGALFGAAKNHIIHFAATQLARVAFAHYPAQAFDNVGFAAPVRPDNACQACFDINLCAFLKGFEAGNFQ